MQFTIIISLINLGFFGGFTHCSAMCGPFVLSQISTRLQNLKVEQYSQLQKLKNFALLPYHTGRILTYSLIGAVCSAITANLKNFAFFNKISAILLFFAAALFLQNIFAKNKNFLPKIKIPKILERALKKLFANPVGWRGFFLGIILGFIPCGLLYAALAIAASIANPVQAFFAMLLFGLSTFPALFLSGLAGYLLFKNLGQKLKLISQIIIFINAITLLFIAISTLRT